MKTEVLYNSNMHFEHRLWRGELEFWKDELRSFNNRLSELVTRWTNKEVLKQLEHYQNEFVLHGGVIEDLEEIIEDHETRIARQSKIAKDVIDTELAKKHIIFRKRLEAQREIYTALKNGFFLFLDQYM
ncbi:hypothetical protein [Winogradskyella wichelsiae]|uniref:hypothetical protein n=1 Tax=Winogradskyella wichelsiae TaxID=2697007 RepID=UPI0015CD72A4|nr:hypothetical protein [Winogradskyella wichelsiae]